ncbi:G protein-coupled receptor-6.4 [Elephant endotheliotropic herpesvirus 3A]|uniref:G protein-coupled receptor-6.4 n=1 Tax=Elephant endotheliotropic herpesvirus 3A TaxID=1329409 RepID=A0A866VSG9_9BETA|nr:G protein-coupled receptor-6.4 [Elephant endotheliotropic herpesvirus 3A]QOE74362.1 G protein-coupled receptor-6.4 [Elephant endotheliotropic herpesvirus 3A]
MFSNGTNETGLTTYPTSPPPANVTTGSTDSTTTSSSSSFSVPSCCHMLWGRNLIADTGTMSVYFMVAAVVGLLLSVAAVLLFVYLIKKGNFRFDFPENSTSVQVLFLLGTCALFLVTAFHVHHPEHAEPSVCTPLVLCLSCLLAGAVNLRLIRKHEIVLPTWALAFVVVFCTFITPMIMFNRYSCMVYTDQVYRFQAKVCGSNLSSVSTTTATVPLRAPGGNGSWGFDTTYVFIYYLTNVAAGTALFSLKTSCHAKYLCWTLSAVWFLWTSHWCMYGLVASNALLTVNGYIFLILYVTPSLVFSYKRQRRGRRRSSYRRAMIVLDGYSGSLAITDGGGGGKSDDLRSMLP